MREEDKTERREVRFPKPVLSAIRLVLTIERLADAARAITNDWDNPDVFRKLRIALTAYDAAKSAALEGPTAPEAGT